MRKILSNYLYELAKKKDINVKIGCSGGSSFFYCHKLTPNSLVVIDKKYDYHKGKSIKLLKQCEYKLEHLDEIYDDIIVKALKNAEKDRVNGKKINEEEFIKRKLIAKENERKRLPKVIGELKYNIEHSFLNREVKEVVDGISPDEQPCKIIYIKGYERGDYWTLKEYAKKNKD